MEFETTGEDIDMHTLTAPEWDLIEDNLHLKLSEAVDPEHAEPILRDMQRLREALGKVLRHE